MICCEHWNVASPLLRSRFPSTSSSVLTYPGAVGWKALVQTYNNEETVTIQFKNIFVKVISEIFVKTTNLKIIVHFTPELLLNNTWDNGTSHQALFCRQTTYCNVGLLATEVCNSIYFEPTLCVFSTVCSNNYYLFLKTVYFYIT